MKLQQRTVFLDRDGTLNPKPPDDSYITDAAGLSLLPGVADAVRVLNRHQAVTIVITNQRGIARGLMTHADLAGVHQALRRQLAIEGAHVDAILYCPHEQGVCSCRKPKTGLIEHAFRHIAGARSAGAVVIGDSDADIEAAKRASILAVAVGDGPLSASPDLRASDLRDAVRALLDHPEPNRGHVKTEDPHDPV